MSPNQLLDCIGCVQDAYIHSALNTIYPSANRSARHSLPLRKKRALLLAAAIAISLLLLGCGAAVLLRLSSMRLGTSRTVISAGPTQEGSTSAQIEVTHEMLSLQGLKGSPNYLAAQEWLAFKNTCTADEIEDDFNAPEKYDAYSAYNQKMMDKLDEIMEKYDLLPLGKRTIIQRYQSEILYEALSLPSLIRSDSSAEVENLSGYFYEGGTFQADFDLTLPDAEGQKSSLTLRYSDKSYLDTVFLSFSEDDSIEWSYSLADGSQVLIVVSDYKGNIFMDRSDAFISVSIYEGYKNAEQFRELLETVADTIDFSMKPQAVSDMAAIEEKLAKAKETQTEIPVAKESTSLEVPNTFKEYITYAQEILPGMAEYFALYDMNGDGQPELLLGDENGIRTFCWLSDGEIYKSGGSTAAYLYICEGNVVDVCWDQGDNLGYTHVFHSYDPTTFYYTEQLEAVTYYPHAGHKWFTQDIGGNETAITEAEYTEIMNSHPRIDIELRPVSEYPE